MMNDDVNNFSYYTKHQLDSSAYTPTLEHWKEESPMIDTQRANKL